MPSWNKLDLGRGAALLIIIGVFANIVCGQQAMTSAALSGRVEDTSGAIVADASVTIKNLETNLTQVIRTNSEGHFRVPFLRVGKYELSVEAPGFARLTRGLTISVGQTLDLSLRLPVAGVAGQVDITADVPMLETTRVQLAETVSPREIDSLPLNGRNYLDLAALTPGVTRSNPVANRVSPKLRRCQVLVFQLPGSASSTTVLLSMASPQTMTRLICQGLSTARK